MIFSNVQPIVLSGLDILSAPGRFFSVMSVPQNFRKNIKYDTIEGA